MERRIVNHKDEVPMQHYAALFAAADPAEIARRCGVPFDPETQCFSVTLLGRPFLVSHPDFALLNPDGTPAADASARTGAAARLLLIRNLLEGHNQPGSGRFLAYREMPWGDVYNANFQGRCIKRLAFSFGSRLPDFERAMTALGGVRIPLGDVGYEIAFLGPHRLQMALWAGDDEFPPSSQILFSDGFPAAFSAEDMAVVGDVAIGTMKELAK